MWVVWGTLWRRHAKSEWSRLPQFSIEYGSPTKIRLPSVLPLPHTNPPLIQKSPSQLNARKTQVSTCPYQNNPNLLALQTCASFCTSNWVVFLHNTSNCRLSCCFSQHFGLLLTTFSSRHPSRYILLILLMGYQTNSIIANSRPTINLNSPSKQKKTSVYVQSLQLHS